VWTREETPIETPYLRRVTRTKRGFVAVGDFGAIMLANLSDSLENTISGAVTLEVFVKSDGFYQLQESTDMTNWTDVGAPIQAGGELGYQKLIFGVSEKKFFRVVPESP